ncbi:ABC-type uncharacterized transport system permease subunit [Staphylococcus hominis]|uniref:hypothetical protein n=1 Tax=Staphylococcus hominis TaxID=1290 RepID=UPI00143E807F|nr:hypothetical protein [Staphylococcus hominis]QIY36326.1 hypothetical protein FOC53_02025 [Staphylococcus hominis]
MSWQLIIFFLAGPIIIGIGNLVLGPTFNKRIPFRVRIRSFMIGSMIYLILAFIAYFFLLQGKL